MIVERWLKQRVSWRSGWISFMIIGWVLLSTPVWAASSTPGHLPGFPLVVMHIEGTSMAPTITNGQAVWVQFERAHYSYHDNQIVIFASPVIPRQYWVKRILATAGQTIAVRANQVFINGKVVEEPFVRYPQSVNIPTTYIPKGYVWVEGDNRPRSYDSRLFGLLPSENIVGLVFVHRPPS